MQRFYVKQGKRDSVNGTLFFDYHQVLSTFESDVHFSFAEVNITILRLINLNVNLKMHQFNNSCRNND